MGAWQDNREITVSEIIEKASGFQLLARSGIGEPLSLLRWGPSVVPSPPGSRRDSPRSSSPRAPPHVAGGCRAPLLQMWAVFLHGGWTLRSLTVSVPPLLLGAGVGVLTRLCQAPRVPEETRAVFPGGCSPCPQCSCRPARSLKRSVLLQSQGLMEDPGPRLSLPSVNEGPKMPPRVCSVPGTQGEAGVCVSGKEDQGLWPLA